jgi:hypothetical protein
LAAHEASVFALLAGFAAVFLAAAALAGALGFEPALAALALPLAAFAFAAALGFAGTTGSIEAVAGFGAEGVPELTLAPASDTAG